MCGHGEDRPGSGGWEQKQRWCFTSLSGGGYQSKQPSTWLNLTGSECCFLRMFTTPGSLLLWNVVHIFCVCVCVDCLSMQCPELSPVTPATNTCHVRVFSKEPLSNHCLCSFGQVCVSE